MTDKLVVIIKSLKIPKIKKILLCEMKILVPNCSCLQNPWLGGYRPQIPVFSVLCPQLNLLKPPPPNKIPGYATDFYVIQMAIYVHNWRVCVPMKQKLLRKCYSNCSVSPSLHMSDFFREAGSRHPSTTAILPLTCNPATRTEIGHSVPILTASPTWATY